MSHSSVQSAILASIESLEEAAALIYAGKCHEHGCIEKHGKHWKVRSNKTGKLWPANYTSHKKAAGALAGYHMHKRG